MTARVRLFQNASPWQPDYLPRSPSFKTNQTSPPPLHETPPIPPITMSTQESELIQLKAKALKAYAQKDYASSTELYASACELQSVLYGENNPRNAHLLYLYGRSLFEVALKKSDVLGGAAQEDKKPKDEKKGKKAMDKLEGASGAEVAIGKKALEKGAKVGLFSFTGDENWDDSDGEEDAGEEGEGEGEEAEKEGEEDDDDFTLAWEILDYARVLFLKQLSPDTSDTKAGATSDVPPAESTTTDTPTKEVAESKVAESKEDKPESKEVPKLDITKPVVPSGDEAKALHTALADTYDLLGEVSLESESFAQAARDLRSSLDLKLELYPVESTLISEAHYKLSLALEFAAAGEDVSDNDKMKGREEAAVEMEKAIASCRARIEKEEKAAAALAALDDDDKGKGKEYVTKSLTDAREMVEELETRVCTFPARSTPQPGYCFS